MIFIGKINKDDVRAKLVLFRSPYDNPRLNLRRWGFFCHFFDKNAIGQYFSGVDKSRGDSFTLFPTPNQSYQEDIALEKAILFITRLGFVKE